MRIFVTDGDNRAALAITRSLGRLGHHVVVGHDRPGSIAQASRYCSERVTYPDPVAHSDRFLDAVASIVRERRVDLLIPVSDITTFLVSGRREQFACIVLCADVTAVERAADKVDVVRTAGRIGVPVPRGLVIERSTPIPPVDHLGYPIVIKSRRSRLRTSAGWVSTTVSYADSRAQLERILAERPAHEFPILLQERVVGPGIGVFACMHQGRAVALFSHQRLRERPPWGGVSVLSASTNLDPVVADHATRLLEVLGWQGVAMVEFKRDERDGLPRLMEINGRFWGSLQLAIDAGVDFPALLVQTVTGVPFPPQPPYRVGVRERWFWGDVDALLVSLFPASNAARLAGCSRMRAIRDFLELWASDLYYDNPKWDDRAPFIAETRSWFRRLVQGAQQRQKLAGRRKAQVTFV